MARKKAAPKSRLDETSVKSDTDVVLPNGKTKTLKAGLIYKNLPESVLTQL